ncbi:MAG: L,D-transpeptidase family protein [Candidatus Woesebacteria bacterium]|jgi:lipoprotein-anchoring transpeptidase ErfK/SrfK
MAAKAKKIQAEDKKQKGGASGVRRKVLIWVGVILAVIILLTGGLFVWFYGNYTAPSVSVGRIDVSNRTEDEVRKAVESESKFNITFATEAKQTVVSNEEIGLTVDVDATVKDVLAARKSGDVLQNLQLWQSKDVPLVFINDPGMLKIYIQENYPEIFVDAVDAQLVFNDETHQYDIVEGTDGSGFDLRAFEAALPELALDPHDVTLTVATAPVEPIIKASGLQTVQQDINNRINLPIKFIMDGSTIYQLNQADIASWTHFMPDFVNGTATIEFDKGAVEQLVDKTLSPKVTVTPIDRKVVIDKATGVETVLSAGRTGWTIQDADAISVNVVDALNQNKSLDQTIKVTEAPFKTVTMAGTGKWIEVDISSQTVTIYAGDTAVQTFLVSTGKAATPTAIGEGSIYAKYPLKTMSGTINGEYYYVPNIKWVSFFYGGEAFHGTYWHHNFGTPMSHGCINMTEADAKILYDFAPIGTKVIVHQ